MNACSESRIAYQVLGGRKAGDLADSGQDRHGRKHAHAGELEQQWHLLVPLLTRTQLSQVCFDLRDERVEGVEQGQILPHSQALGGGELQREPPRSCTDGKGLAPWGSEILSL